MLLIILLLLNMTLQIVTPQQLRDECYHNFNDGDFWESCGACGLCLRFEVGEKIEKWCEYNIMEQIFIPESKKECKIADHCAKQNAHASCNNVPCVPMLGTFKCVCNTKNFGRLCQYKISSGMSMNSFAVLENFLYTPYYTQNKYLTVSLMFSSLGNKEDLKIVIETPSERLIYNWKVCQRLDRSHVIDYCKSLFVYNKQFCNNNLFQYNNVKWVFTARIPIPGMSLISESRVKVRPGNVTRELRNYVGYIDSVKLAIYNKRDSNPIFDIEFASANILISPQFSHCQPVVIIKEGGQTQFDVIKLPRSKEITIETLYMMPLARRCITQIEDLHIEWVIWIYEINHSEVDTKYFMKKLQVTSIEFKRYSIAPALYKVRTNVTLWFESKEGFSAVYSYFEVVLLELEPILQGGYSRSLYFKSSKIVLNGSMSKNPNETPSEEAKDLLYYWTCDKSKKIYPGKYTAENFIIFNGPFIKNEIYSFTLTLISRKYNLRKSATQKVIIVSDPSPTLEIICKKNCGDPEFQSNPAESIYLEVLIVEVPFGYYWKINNQFTWVFRSEKEENFKSIENIKQRSAPDNVLIILANTLLGGETYLFQVKGGSDFPGEATFKLKMATAIKSFSCDVEQNYVEKAQFTNTITCDRLFFQNLSPTYEYYDRYPDKSTNDKGRLLGSKYINVLKNVGFVRGNLVVEVTNQYGIMSSAEVKLEFKPEKNIYKVVQSLIDNIEFYHTTMDSEFKSSIISAIIDIISSEEERFPKATDIIESLLVIVNKEMISSFTKMKLWTHAMDILVTEGANIVIKPESVLCLSEIVMKLSDRFNLYVTSSENVFYDLSSRETFEIVQSLVNICDKIFTSEHEGYDETFYSIYKVSTENTFQAIEMIMKSLKTRTLPFIPPFDIKAKAIGIWMKVDTPFSFYNLSFNRTLNESIPSVIVSKALANYLNHWSNLVTVQVMVFEKNPFLWYKKLIISTNVIDLKFGIKRGNDNEYITELHYPVQINLGYQDLKIAIINGSLKQPNENDSIDKTDWEVAIHKIRVEERGILKLKFLGLKEGEIFKVLALYNLRPDYILMMEKGQTITQSAPEYEQGLQDPTSSDIYDLYYLGIVASHLHAGENMNYSFEITILRCVSWHHRGWTSKGCKVKGIIPSSKELQCECEHLSSFAGFAGVPMNTVNPLQDHRLLLTVLDNPFVALFVVCILIFYFIILFYTVQKDRRDKYKQQAIYLEDNLPYDKYPYLVCVQTGARFFAGTTSNVGISVEGEKSASRSHILKSAIFKALERADDNWFIMFTPHYLGEIKLIHIWIDFSGYRPEWFCDKIVVIDLTEKKEYTFLINSWFSLRWDDHFERFVKTATLEEKYREELASDNFIFGFREAHLWLSVVSKHPRSTVSASQRLSLAFCGLFAVLLTSCMFFKAEEQLEDYPQYRVTEVEILISVYSMVVSAFITNSVLSLFRKQLIIFDPGDEEEEDEEEEDPSAKLVNRKKIKQVEQKQSVCTRLIQNIFKVLVSKKKFLPVHLEIDVLSNGKKRSFKTICYESFAWSLCLFIIVFSAYLVILYGLKFGKVKSLEWLSSIVMSLGEEVFLTSPVKIITLAVFSGLLFANIYNVSKYEIDWNVILKYKKQLLKTKRDLFKKLVVLRGKAIYVPLSCGELAKKRQKLWKKDAFWLFLDFIFIGFLTILLIIQMGTLWSTRYYWNNLQLKSNFKKGYKQENFQTEELTNITDYLPFLERKILPLIHQIKWYNGLPITDENNSTEVSQTFALSSTSCLLGLPRLRQRRQLPGSCKKNRFSGLPDLCPSRLTENTEDTEMYVEGWKNGPFEKFVSLSPWSYQEPSESYDVVAFGYNSLTYSGGGYIADLGLSLSASEEVITNLNIENWLDKLTSIAFFEMTLYNPNSGTLSVLIAVTERLYMGMMMNRLYVFSVSEEYEVPAIDLIIFVSLLIFIIRVILVFNRRGFKNTLISFWNTFELVIVFLGIYCAFLYIQHIKKMNQHLKAYSEREKEEYFHFINIISDLTHIQVVMTLLVIIIACRFIKSLQFGYVFFHTVISGLNTLILVSCLIIVTIIIYWQYISYFLNIFVLSRRFMIVYKFGFEHIIKSCVHTPCKVSINVLSILSEVIALMIVMNYLHRYKKIKAKRKEEGVYKVYGH